MKYIEKNGNVYVSGINDFHLGQTLECGQCFHFERVGDNEYYLSAKGRFLHILQKNDFSLVLYNTNLGTFEDVWKDYFDLDRDYRLIKSEINKLDDKLKPAMETMWGIRILNQDFFETMISFIISQNKQIPHIKKIVADLSCQYGALADGAERIYQVASADEEDSLCNTILNRGVFYSFPDVSSLLEAGEDGIRKCKTGFRAPYIIDACRKYSGGELDESVMRSESYIQVMERLKHVHGIGDKVANCIALFGLGKRNAFPVDVWIKRIMEYIYIGHESDKKEISDIAERLFGEYGGYAQQYLFYYGKEMKLGKPEKTAKTKELKKV